MFQQMRNEKATKYTGKDEWVRISEPTVRWYLGLVESQETVDELVDDLKNGRCQEVELATRKFRFIR